MSSLNRNVAPGVNSTVPDVTIPTPEVVHLDNGIPVTVINSGCQDVHRITFMWDGGNVEAPSPSIANLVVQLLREGTHSLTGTEISNVMEYNGAWIRGSVHPHNTAVVVHALNNSAKMIYPVLYDMISNPTFPEESTDAIKENLAGNLETNFKRVDFISQLLIRDMIFGENHRLSRKEKPEEIRNIDRMQLSLFHKQYMQLPDLYIYIAGKITDDLMRELNNVFGRVMYHHESSVMLDITPVQTHAFSSRRINLSDLPDANQSSVKIAFPVVARNSPDYIPLRIATIALGGYFGSRLMSNIREEKGLTYGINAGLYGYREGSMVLISAQSSNETVRPLIDETCREINRLKTVDMSCDEITRLKRFVLTQLMAQLDTPFAMMDYYENLRKNDIKGNYFQEQWRAINSITVQQISEMAEKYLNLDKMSIAIAGDAKSINISL